MRHEADEDPLRITQQFRSGEAMIYDFRGKSGRLTLRVTAREGKGDRAPTAWRIDAATSTAADAVIVSEWGTTRAEALRAVGRAWTERHTANHLPLFDWDSVERAMTAVRAI